jgi:hypothetical protein
MAPDFVKDEAAGLATSRRARGASLTKSGAIANWPAWT